MRLRLYAAIIILVVICIIVGLSTVFAYDTEFIALLNKIAERINSYPEKSNLKCTVVAKIIGADKEWNPVRTQTIKSTIRAIDNKIEEEIMQVLETENGKTRDVTQEYIKRWDAMLETFNKKDIDQQLKNNKDIPPAAVKQIEDEMDMLREGMNDSEEKDSGETEYDYLPFTGGNRARYRFKRAEDSVIAGRSVFVIEAKPIKKDKTLDEGKYYVDQETFDVLMFQGKPSKDSIPFFDLIDKEVQYEVLPEGNFVRKRLKSLMSADILGMNFGRLINETEFSDYEILPPGNTYKDAREVLPSEKSDLIPVETIRE